MDKGTSMTILTLGKITIDTDLDHEVHKKEIEKHTNFFCEKNRPEQWFTQPSPDKSLVHYRISGEVSRFFNLHYNDDGSKLIKVNSYDYIYHTTKMVRGKKGVDNSCYFSKNSSKKCDVYEMVEETDYDSPVSVNHIDWWKREKTFWGKLK